MTRQKAYNFIQKLWWESKEGKDPIGEQSEETKALRIALECIRATKYFMLAIKETKKHENTIPTA